MAHLARRALLTAAAAGALPLRARAQGLAEGSWPSGTIRIVVPFAPGGSTDVVARLAAPGIQRALGVSVVVENRGGAAGSTGTDVVAKARPDGQTWLLTFDSHAVMPVLVPRLPFDLKGDLEPVTLIGGAPYVVACRPDKPFRDLAGIVAAAKASPSGVTFATPGNGTIGHLVMTLLGSRAGVQFQHLPYRGGGPAVNDAVAGHVDMVVGSAALVAPQVAGGTLRPIAQFGPQRLPALAQVPTAEESGFPGLQAEAWWGVFAPARVPAPVVARFHEALVSAFRDEAVSKQITEGQQARLVLAGPQELGRFLDAQIETWSRVVRENEIKAD
ncbi:tripartite tricarboxylate transporter substrate binding protein [Roseomonas indoligenes]|uniref:Tripartite tricarboxylate transporter substrate binding protein n=1 Tax=Roseomonas indoligenes TaxID=2820811 RepID=A0A940N2G3_9PROT|nr:tripartite tricarboxylate transporter substrate binding protein [Pararoseomonas indoligenes]MBP0495354.1 tripartite tricarboxylate transporter substrate binding protein [Pararoseomonas indoligenes]